MGGVAGRFAIRHQRKLRSSLRHAGGLMLISALLLAGTAAPHVLGWWDAALPAAIGSAVAALLVFAAIVNTPLEAFAFVGLYFDRDGLPGAPSGFGRTLYRESGRLDALAREAGLTPLSEFESADPLDTRQVPVWHAPEAALPTVEHLLACVARPGALHRC